MVELEFYAVAEQSDRAFGFLVRFEVDNNSRRRRFSFETLAGPKEPSPFEFGLLLLLGAEGDVDLVLHLLRHVLADGPLVAMHVGRLVDSGVQAAQLQTFLRPEIFNSGDPAFEVEHDLLVAPVIAQSLLPQLFRHLQLSQHSLLLKLLVHP